MGEVGTAKELEEYLQLMALSGEISLVLLLPQGKRKLRPHSHSWLFPSVLPRLPPLLFSFIVPF